MTLCNTPVFERIVKLTLAAVLGLVASSWALLPVAAQAQASKIVLQCVAPLVPNSDGSDCVRPAVSPSTSCPAFLQPFQGRCIEPNHYIKFRNCSGNPSDFEIAIYPSDLGEDFYVLFINGKRQSANSDKVFGLFGARAASGDACRLN